MNRLEVFSGKRSSFPINMKLGGLGGLSLDKNAIVEGTSLTYSNIKNFTDDNVDLYFHVTEKFEFYNGFVGTSTSTQNAKLNNISSIIDYESNIIDVNNNSFAFSSLINFESLGLTNLKSTAFLNARNIERIWTPNVKSLGSKCFHLSGFNHNKTIRFDDIQSSIGELTNVGTGIGIRSNISFTKEYAQVINNIEAVFQLNSKIEMFPFPNATGIRKQAFRNTYSLQGDIILNNVTGNLNARFLCESSALSKLILPNITSITSPERMLLNTNNLIEVDFRSVNSIEYLGYTNISGNNANLLIHAHIDLKTSNNGSPHQEYQNVISAGGTIKWYNNDGTLNSQTN